MDRSEADVAELSMPIGEAIFTQRSWWAKRKADRGWNGPEDVPPGDTSHASAMRLADEMKDVPCVAFILSEAPHQAESVLLSAQNLMLAARALGIGSVPTRLHPGDYGEFRALFGVPERIGFHFAIPLGLPEGQVRTHQPQADGRDHPLERVGRGRAMGVTAAVS